MIVGRCNEGREKGGGERGSGKSGCAHFIKMSVEIILHRGVIVQLIRCRYRGKRGNSNRIFPRYRIHGQSYQNTPKKRHILGMFPNTCRSHTIDPPLHPTRRVVLPMLWRSKFQDWARALVHGFKKMEDWVWW